MSMKSLIRLAALAAVTSLAVSTASAQITIPTVTIGNPGNAPDPFTGNLYGSVSYVYNIGTTEVTNAQYAAFLNAKAKSDPLGLYHPNMAAPLGGIYRVGSAGSYTYEPVNDRANHPVNWISFWNACRFANWLHNGQGSGDTETGAYTLGGLTNPVNHSVTRNEGWRWAVTSEDEWYKAAYYQPASQGGDTDNYWLYPTSSNALPIGEANFQGYVNRTVPVGSYRPNIYGTFDMGGNVEEWNEAIPLDFSSRRVIRGGSFQSTMNSSAAASRWHITLPDVYITIGFRVVQRIPPCPADYDGSAFVDSDDFMLYVTQFSLGCTGAGQGALGADPACVKSADFDNSGFVDSDDYIAYVQAFEAGC